MSRRISSAAVLASASFAFSQGRTWVTLPARSAVTLPARSTSAAHRAFLSGCQPVLAFSNHCSVVGLDRSYYIAAAVVGTAGWAATRRAFGSSPTSRASEVFGMPSAKITVLTTEDAPEKAEKVADACRTLGDAATSVEEVKSYYWWEGKVNFDPEWRLAVSTSSSFDAASEAISKAHSYDLPMIIYDLENAPDNHDYWKGVVKCSNGEAAIELAKVLVERRVVACAQAAPDGSLAVKTVSKCKSMVQESSSCGDVTWSPIGGNDGYLKWLEDECVAAKS
eukprot:TRINITY_DN37617_c0_g1_i2.p1 TRINITY_DN37617_c0_g1~~TRINITY_DN37617_c0_g1_i2.p1  ORF type:complete len:280 (-),score=60.27 TRINITY_DN37617_c0_g1_i2:78-917(-)